MRFIPLLISLFLLVEYGRAQPLPMGHWRGSITYEKGDVPFEFAISEGDPLTMTIKNGEENMPIDSVKIVGDSIFFHLTPFDAQLSAKVGSNVLTGYWKKGYRTEGIPFHATYGIPRFNKSGKAKHKKWIGKWQVLLSSATRSPYPAVLILEQRGTNMSGTFLTEVGDFRYFDGVVRNDSIYMSSFDGAHAFLFKGLKKKDSLSGILLFDESYTEQVKGTKHEAAAIIAPFKAVEPGHRPYYDILSAGDTSASIDEGRYMGKVLVLQLFGTWCPNSMDQTRFLAKWYSTKPKEVDVLGVTFEPNFSHEYGKQRIADYKRDMNLRYDIVPGGKLSKGQAALGLPHLDEIQAFPTLLILDKDGFIRYEFSYFNGPATGVHYQEFIDKFNACIDELVKE